MNEVTKNIIGQLNAGVRKPFTGQYPKTVGYSDKYSIGNNATLDLLVSYSNLIVAQNTPLNEGGGILVTARRDEELVCFAGIVTNEIYSKPKIWCDEGGQTWKYNYNIVRASNVTALNLVMVEAIAGYKMRNLMMFSGAKNLNSKKSVMISVGSVWRYLYTNERNINQDLIGYDNIEDLVNKFSS